MFHSSSTGIFTLAQRSKGFTEDAIKKINKKKDNICSERQLHYKQGVQNKEPGELIFNHAWLMSHRLKKKNDAFMSSIELKKKNNKIK